MRPLLETFNTYENPEVEDHVHVIVGKNGEIFVTVRPVEAWDRFAEVNGFTDTSAFMEHMEDTVVWTKAWHRADYDGTVMETVPLQGYYRDGDKHL